MQSFRTGYISIVGRPNVGKSTLLNRLVQQKLSIVSRKPQTTRWSLHGIKTTKNAQIIYIDTPGLQKNPKLALNRYMNKEVINSLTYIDAILFVIEVKKWNELDENVLATLKKVSKNRIILVINKIDKLKDKNEILSFIGMINNKTGLTEIMPVSAKKNIALDKLENLIVKKLPIATAIYPEEQITDRGERFFAAEFIREKLISRLNQEIPYRLSITIDEFKSKKTHVDIHATIWVEKKGQKSIVIGTEGNVLKAAGKAAREDLEKLYNRKINLKTWVKVKSNWADSENALKQLGFSD
ncbi:MAG: GTPase Era [Proteobacteria bacterium]|nr:GTPase Era [Pseudomonadota bacterium]